jgi:hypothetical protein
MRDKRAWEKQIVIAVSVFVVICIAGWIALVIKQNTDITEMTTAKAATVAPKQTEAELLKDQPLIVVNNGPGVTSLSTLSESTDPIDMSNYHMEVMATGALVFRVLSRGWSSSWVIVRGDPNRTVKVKVSTLNIKQEMTENVSVKLGKDGSKRIAVKYHPGLGLLVR